MPRTHGDSFVHVSEVDYLVELTHKLPELPTPPADYAAQAIGKLASRLVRDGDTLQLGIGAIPDATLAELARNRSNAVTLSAQTPKSL